MKHKAILMAGIVLLLAMIVASAGTYDPNSKLQVKKVTVDVDGDDSTVDQNEVSREKIKPGSSLDIDVELFNNYAESSDEDFDIEDVEVTVTILEIDDGDDLEESDDISKIAAQRDKTAKVSFEIPWELEDDEYDVEILVEGDDENGTDYDFTWDFKLEVDKEKHDIKILRANLEPDVLVCSGTTTLSVELLNIGEEDEDEVMLTIKNSDLKLDITEEELELDEGVNDDSRFSDMYDIKAEEPGTYTIMVRAFYKEGRETDNQKVDLVVQECPVVEEPEEEEEEEEVEVITPPEEEEVTPPVIITPEPTFWDQYGLALIIAAYIVVILIGILVLVRLFKK